MRFIRDSSTIICIKKINCNINNSDDSSSLQDKRSNLKKFSGLLVRYSRPQTSVGSQDQKPIACTISFRDLPSSSLCERAESSSWFSMQNGKALWIKID